MDTAHIIHKTLSTGCKNLEIDKFFKHFLIYAVRIEKFKELCTETDHFFKPLQNHSGTKFLSLYPAVNRIVEIYDFLQKYFKKLD